MHRRPQDERGAGEQRKPRVLALLGAAPARQPVDQRERDQREQDPSREGDLPGPVGRRRHEDRARTLEAAPGGAGREVGLEHDPGERPDRDRRAGERREPAAPAVAVHPRRVRAVEREHEQRAEQAVEALQHAEAGERRDAERVADPTSGEGPVQEEEGERRPQVAVDERVARVEDPDRLDAEEQARDEGRRCAPGEVERERVHGERRDDQRREQHEVVGEHRIAAQREGHRREQALAEHVLAERVRVGQRMARPLAAQRRGCADQAVRVPGDDADHHRLVEAAELEEVPREALAVRQERPGIGQDGAVVPERDLEVGERGEQRASGPG